MINKVSLNNPRGKNIGPICSGESKRLYQIRPSCLPILPVTTSKPEGNVTDVNVFTWPPRTAEASQHVTELVLSYLWRFPCIGFLRIYIPINALGDNLFVRWTHTPFLDIWDASYLYWQSNRFNIFPPRATSVLPPIPIPILSVYFWHMYMYDN